MGSRHKNKLSLRRMEFLLDLSQIRIALNQGGNIRWMGGKLEGSMAKLVAVLWVRIDFKHDLDPGFW
jgi:hypothetical protein